MGKIKKCKKCGKYTLKDKCPGCGGKAVDHGPGKFSPQDRYGEYRRKEKLKSLGSK